MNSLKFEEPEIPVNEPHITPPEMRNWWPKPPDWTADRDHCVLCAWRTPHTEGAHIDHMGEFYAIDPGERVPTLAERYARGRNGIGGKFLRAKILRYLQLMGPHTTKDLNKAFPGYGRNVVTRAVRYLKDSGSVTTHRTHANGPWLVEAK